MNEAQIEIVKLFCKDFSRDLTIRQISKLVKKSYGFINKEVRNMFELGVLNKRVIGPSILCSLNLKSDLTLGLLSMNSILEKENYLKNKPKLKEKLEDFISNLVGRAVIYTILLVNNKLVVVCDNETHAHEALTHVSVEGIEINLIEGINFDSEKIDLDNTIIVYGFEPFWRLMNVKR